MLEAVMTSEQHVKISITKTSCSTNYEALFSQFESSLRGKKSAEIFVCWILIFSKTNVYMKHLAAKKLYEKKKELNEAGLKFIG